MHVITNLKNQYFNDYFDIFHETELFFRVLYDYNFLTKKICHILVL